MELILSQNVAKLGKIGDVVRVKTGYARNYLLPKKLAYPATPTNLKRIESQKAKLAAEAEKVKKEAEALAEKMAKVSCTVTVEVNDLEKLYGSVTEHEIVHALETEGFKVDKQAVKLENPITELGIYDVEVVLHPEVSAKVRIWVAKK